MPSELLEGGFWSQPSLAKDQKVRARDIAMIIGTEIIGGEVAAGAETGMTGMGTAGGTAVPIVEAGVTAEALVTARRKVEEDMMTRSGAAAAAAAVHMEVLLLVELALVQGEAPHPGDLLGVKVLLCVVVKNGLLFQGVSHHVAGQLIPAASLLE